MNNKFISFEGCEGSGKTTLSSKLYNHLLSCNIPVILTREIGGTEEAELIRKIIVGSELLPMSELLLILAARYEHVNKVIIPALKEGKWVICDRFIDSTFAYQGALLPKGFNLVYELHERLIEPCFKNIQRSYMPDLTFFIDLPVELSLARTKNRHDNNKFEAKGLLFHKQIYQNFLSLQQKFNNRIIKINASDKNPINEINNILFKDYGYGILT